MAGGWYRRRPDWRLQTAWPPRSPSPKAPKLPVLQDRRLERAPVRFGQVTRVAGPGALPPHQPVGPQQVVAAGPPVIECFRRERDGALGLVVGGVAGGDEETSSEHGHSRRGGGGVGEQLRILRAERVEETPEGRQRPGLGMRSSGEEVVEDEIGTRQHLAERREDIALHEAPAHSARSPLPALEDGRGGAVTQVGEEGGAD